MVAEIAERHDATAAQVAPAWLPASPPALLPIPGTGSVGHPEENLGAAGLALSADDLARLDAAA